MSYDRMNHGEWVQNNINAERRRTRGRKLTARETKARADRRGWHGAPELLNAFHHRAFAILGVVGGGIYNAPIEWDSVEWRADSLCLNWRGELATRDFRGLTDLVFLAHDAGIRVSISPNMRNLRMILHCRARPPLPTSFSGHPTLEAGVEAHRARFPSDHPVHLENAPPPLALIDAAPSAEGGSDASLP
jgi:hypothetical protein